MLEQVAGLIDTVLIEDGVDALYWSITSRNTTSLKVNVMDQDPIQVDDGEGNITEIVMTDIKFRTADLPETPVKGDRITIVDTGEIYEARPVDGQRPKRTKHRSMTRVHTQLINS